MQLKFCAAVMAGLVALLLSAPTGAAEPERKTLKTTYTGLYFAVKDEHGKRAPGRNIRRLGVKTKKGTRDATFREIAKSIRTLRSMLTAPKVLDPGAPKVPPSGALSMRVKGGHLAAIRACESGGNYGAVDPSGTYKGAYQFDQQTWESVGGSGNPAAASPAEQDKRAAILYARRGAQPWPVCGR